MNWSELTPQARAALLAVAFLAVVAVVWTFVLTPLRERATGIDRDVTTAEAQLEQLEREIEGIPPASEAERTAWRASTDELLARLAPESELPLVLESLTRLAESQGVEIYITSESAESIGGGVTGGASQSEQVLAAVPGARYVPLNCRIYGDYAATARLLAQVGRLGWVTALAGVAMEREFPELVTEARVIVFFRPDANGGGVDNGSSGTVPGRAGQGG